MKSLFFFIFFITINFVVVAQVKLLSISNDLESSSDSLPWINQATAVKGEAFSGNYYSSTDSIKQFGLGYKGVLPKQCLNKTLHIKFSELIRANVTGNEFVMVITVSVGDSEIFWSSKNISSRLKSPGIWTKMEDEFDLPASMTGKNNILALYLWNKDGKSVVDIDDLKIDFEEKSMPSFLPAGYVKSEMKEGWTKISGSKEITFYYNKETGLIRILNSKGDTIINSLALITEWYDEHSKEKMQAWNYHFYVRKDSTSEEGNSLLLSARDEFSHSDISILAGNSNEVSFNLTTVFDKPITLYRHAIVTSFTLPVKEVYKKSTLSDTADFSDEYWLDKEGFLLSNSKSSIVIYHPENISSIQINTRDKYAVINLDYSSDHPQLHFPLLKKNQNYYEDYSTSVYEKNDTVKGLFTYYSVSPEFKIAKMLTNPNGYLASFIWTEHADYTNMRTQRAIYFGSENITRLEEATGGFLKYSIPVTKSIFYANPDKVDNSDKVKFLPGPVANYKETEGYRNFLKQLDEFGIEICLHTPDHFTSDRKLLGEALDVTRREYSPVTWIDHGYDNSVQSNREDLACDGYDKKSKWYAADLWKKYGIRYFWNSFFEDSAIYKDYSFNSFFSVPYSGLDDAMPTPVYWRNKTRTDDVVHWRTTSTLDPADGSLWSYYFNDLRLNDLVNNRNNIIIHCYPARVDSTNGFYVIKNNIISANEEFNHALQKLSSYRLMKKIWLTTIRDMLNYRTSIERISYHVNSDGSISLHNSGNEIIRGVSFSTFASGVKSGEKEISTKQSGNELIFWFDIGPGENVNLILK